MKVLMVDPGNYTPYYDYHLCRALLALNLDTTWVTSPFLYDDLTNLDNLPILYGFYRSFQETWVARSALANLPTLRKGLKTLEYPLNWTGLIRHMRRHRQDVVHIQWAVMPLLDQWLFRYLKSQDIGLVYTAHDLLPHARRPWHRRLYLTLYRLADGVIAHSEQEREKLVNSFAVSPQKVHVIPHGNFDDFRSQLIPREQAKTRLGIRSDQRTVLFFGRIKPYKGLAILIQAFPQIKQQITGATLLIAGHSTESFRSYRAAIERLGIAQDVRVDLTFVPQREVGTYFCAADVVVLPYLNTTTSGVLLMAYTFGRPVVATSVGGLPETVVERKSGYLVPPGDPAKLADAVCAVLADAEQMAQMGSYARHLAETVHAWPRIAKATLEVYAGCLRGMNSQDG